MSSIHSTSINSPRELASLIKNTKCVIIKFSASWCGPCQNKEFKHNYSMLKEEFAPFSYIKFVELDLDDDDEIVNSTKYYDFAIKSIPHFKFCYEGDIIGMYDGAQSLPEIYNNLKKVVRNVQKENEKNSSQITQSTQSTQSTHSTHQSISNSQNQSRESTRDTRKNQF